MEWNESEGSVKRTYSGLGKRSAGVVQFDSTKNRFLAAGDDHMVKFWDMDNVNLLTTADAEGGLQVRFLRGQLHQLTTLFPFYPEILLIIILVIDISAGFSMYPI